MHRRFVTEAVMLAIYGQLLAPRYQLEYIIPISTVWELRDLREGSEPIVLDQHDDLHTRKQIEELIRFFEQPFNRKKLEKALIVPWKLSAPLVINDQVSILLVNSTEQAQFGEAIDPIETELLLTAMKEGIPLLTDQTDFQERVIDAEISVQLYDVEDFEFAVEQGMSIDEM